MSYKEPLNTSHIEIEIKKSRFIGFAKKANTRQEAMTFIDELKQSYPDARHICWGYLIGDPNNSTNAGCSDDGEPSGTAGKPILAQINYSNIGNVVVAIVRYFGGIRLGAGGLVRAYRESAQKALLALETEEFVPQEEILIELHFNEENSVRQLIKSFDGELVSSEYSSMVMITALLPSSKVSELELSLGNMKAKIKRL
jgi:uncharacterized YigZ family protein